MPIHIIEHGTAQSAVEAWARSRDLPGEPNASDVMLIDASVTEMPTALFEFQDFMILERELFVTPRNHLVWARTSRVDDPREFRVPDVFRSDFHEMWRATMRELANEGISQDQWRMALPLCALTSWTARLSFRGAVQMARYFSDVAEYIRNKGNNIALGKRINSQAYAIFMAAFRAFDVPFNVIDKATDDFKPLPLAAYEYSPHASRSRFGEFVSLIAQMPIAARAQLARHREIAIVDTLLPTLLRDNAEQLPISTMLTVQAVAPAHAWQGVLGDRTCWMAQSDLWAPLAALYGKDDQSLPCAGGSCPFAEDAKQRLAGNDPGPPCPRYSVLNSAPMTPNQMAAAVKHGRRGAFWSKQMVEVAKLGVASNA